MSTRHRRPVAVPTTHGEAVQSLATALGGSTRREILDAALHGATFPEALRRLRTGMAAHAFPTATGAFSLARMVAKLDKKTREEGFHVLQGWDPIAHRFPDDIIPVLMLEYCAATGISAATAHEALGVLLDYYFLSILSLLAMRSWDDEDPNAALDGVTRLIRALQGPRGSGRQFVDDAETLLLLAISHYHPEETAYDRLVRRVMELDRPHQVRVALAGAAILGSHLRWGFQCMYGRDVGRMRDDNVVDYPWLLFSVATLMREYARLHDGPALGHGNGERDVVVERLLNGLTPDPWAFSGRAPALLSAYEAEHRETRERLTAYRAALRQEFEAHRPTTTAYSPLGFQFNFLPNAVTAIVAMSLSPDGAPNLSLNALFARERGEPAEASAERLARTLMAFSGGRPDRLGAKGAMLVLYDPYDALRSFNAALRTTLGDG